MPGLAEASAKADGRRLAVATGAALLVAGLVLVVAVLPAEYGIDPLGTGKALGLNALYDAASDTNAVRPSSSPPPSDVAVYKTDSRVFTLRPMEGFEYKYRIEKGGGLVYSWTATRPVKYKFHGEHDGAAIGTAVSYEKSAGTRGSGSFTAPASGIHGWFWENTTDDEMTITLTSSGFYRWADEFRQRFDPVKHKGVVDRTRHELADAPTPHE
jgi:hypothetical protein